MIEMTEENSYPSIPEQAKNLAKFSFEVVKQVMNDESSLFVSSEVREQRMEICKSCDYYDDHQVRCRHCGCYLEHKIKFAIDSCPLDKWRTSDSYWMKKEYNDILDRIRNEQLEKEQKKSGPVFPIEPLKGEEYVHEGNTWRYDGHVWVPLDMWDSWPTNQ